jgi:hypothetical protein
VREFFDIEGDDERIDGLFTLAPEEFTAARNALAKELRDEGRHEEAKSLQKLSRPNLGAWALNQLARAQPKLVRELAAAGARLREAQSGGGDVRAATQAERRALEAVASAARETLGAAGRKPTEAVLRTIRTTLRAAATDPDAAAAVELGRLTGPLEPPSLADLLAQVKPRPKTERRSARKEGGRVAERARARRELSAARARAEQERRDARNAADEERRTRREWEQAKKRAEAALRRADGADEAVREAEKALRGR